MTIKNLTAAEVERGLKEDDIILIDVREPAEFAAERIHGASAVSAFHIRSARPARLRRAHCRLSMRFRHPVGKSRRRLPEGGAAS